MLETFMEEVTLGHATRTTVLFKGGSRGGSRKKGGWHWMGKTYLSEITVGAVEVEPKTFLDLMTGKVYRRQEKREGA